MSLAMRSCTIHYGEPDENSGGQSLPDLRSTCAPCAHDKRKFLTYLQSSVNALAADPDAEVPSYGPISLSLPCISADGQRAVEVRAGAVSIEVASAEDVLEDG